jgi:hypothetical protein
VSDTGICNEIKVQSSTLFIDELQLKAYSKLGVYTDPKPKYIYINSPVGTGGSFPGNKAVGA